MDLWNKVEDITQKDKSLVLVQTTKKVNDFTNVIQKIPATYNKRKKSWITEDNTSIPILNSDVWAYKESYDEAIKLLKKEQRSKKRLISKQRNTKE